MTNSIKPFMGSDEPAESTAITTTGATGGFEGEILQTELRIPTLAVAQGVGDLAYSFRPGNIVLNKETLLSDGSTPLEITVLRCRKSYAENIPYGSGQRPRMFDKLQDVIAAGGTLEWINNNPPTYLTVLQCQILVKRPDGVGGEFPYGFKDSDYAMALWTIRSMMAFNRVGRSLLTSIAQLTRSGKPIYTTKWLLSTARETLKNKNTVAVPVLRNAGKHDADFIEFASDML